MTRKGYVQLAQELGIDLYSMELMAVNDTVLTAQVEAFWQVVDTLCGALKRDNARFDVARFTQAIEAQRQASHQARGLRARDLNDLPGVQGYYPS